LGVKLTSLRAPTRLDRHSPSLCFGLGFSEGLHERRAHRTGLEFRLHQRSLALLSQSVRPTRCPDHLERYVIETDGARFLASAMVLSKSS
jgi:hypothetical protein